MGYETLPSVVRDTLLRLQARKYQLDRSGVRGRPLFESVEEVAITLYAIEQSDISKVARVIGYEVPALWRVVQKAKEGKVSYWDVRENRIKTVQMSYEELMKVAEDLLRPKATKRILKSVTDSAVVQEFIRNPERISKSGKLKIYTPSQVRATISRINEIAWFIEEGKARDVFERYGLAETNNPDVWASNPEYERALSEIIQRYCYERHTDVVRRRRCQYGVMSAFHRLKPFRGWFKGEMGTVRKASRPIEETLWLSDYLRLKQYLLSSGKGEERALWAIMALHITTKAREGYDSVARELERRSTVTGEALKSIYEVDLDDDIVNTSLIGIKWDKILVKDGRIVDIEIYESKTETTWHLYRIWLDKDLEDYLLKVREWALAQGIKSVVKSILMYEGVNRRKWSVGSFAEWYEKRVKETCEKVLGKKITPHRLRSAGVSILAELGVPLEAACAFQGFGVGWEDLTTALHFYLRVARGTIEEYFARIEERLSKLTPRS